jgi:hypothetical protein
MRELNVNEIKEVNGGWGWVIKVVDWVGRGSISIDIINSWRNFSKDAQRMSGGSAEQHLIARDAGKIDE